MPNLINTAQFGAGSMFIFPNAGTLATNPTPFKIGGLQDWSCDIKSANEKLYGQNRLPDIVAPGQLDIKIKASFYAIQGLVVSQALLTGTVVAGIKQIVDQEAGTIPATSTYTITCAAAGPILQDYGVNYLTTGRAFKKVASSPTVGQYSVVLSTGVFTFAAADASVAVLLNYTKAASGVGSTFGYTNQKMGNGPQCELVLYAPYTNNTRGWRIPAAYCTSLNMPTKIKGFAIQAIEFDVADAPGDNAIEMFDLS